MKKILVPTDFSVNALNAFEYAIKLAQLFDGQLVLLHTYQAPRRADMFVSLDSIMRRDAEKEMEALTKEVPTGIDFEVKIMKGEIIKTIANFADQNKIDLIVMGTQGTSGLEEVFIGSVTGGVMRHTNTPILAIPENYSYQPIKKIVFALANLELSGPAVVKPLRWIVEKFSAKVVIFHHEKLLKNESNKKFEVLEWLHGIPLSTTFDSETDKVHDSIRKIAADPSVDLLCMVRRKRNRIGFFERLFKESVTSRQVFQCEIPLLVLHSA